MPYDVSPARLFKFLSQGLASPVDFILWVWIGFCILGIGLAAYIAACRPGGPGADSQRDVVVFCATAMVTGTIGFVAFMKILGVPSQPWNYTPLAAFAAVALEGIFSVLTMAALGRLATVVLALSMMASIVLPAWRGVQIRETNIDLIASRLRVSAGPDDMI